MVCTVLYQLERRVGWGRRGEEGEGGGRRGGGGGRKEGGGGKRRE